MGEEAREGSWSLSTKIINLNVKIDDLKARKRLWLYASIDVSEKTPLVLQPQLELSANKQTIHHSLLFFRFEFF
jgi:hypothetical protein